MTNWREKGYVPDSDDDEEEWALSTQDKEEDQRSQLAEGLVGEYTRESGLQNGAALEAESLYNEVEGIQTDGEGIMEITQELSWHESQIKDVQRAGLLGFGIPAENMKDIEVLDLSELKDEEDDELQGQRETTAAEDVPTTPQPVPPRNLSTTPKPSAILPSSDSSPLSEPPSDLHSPTPSPPETRPSRPTLFSIVLPQPSYPPEAWSPTAVSPEEDYDDFTSGPIRNLRQRKPIQLNPYLIEQARYRATLKARGLKPVIIRTEEPEIHASVDQEEEEYQASADEEDESQSRSRRQAAEEDSQLEIQDGLEVNCTPQTRDYDEYDFPDVDTLLREAVRADGVFHATGVKRRKITHIYSNKQSKVPKSGWRPPPKIPTPSTSKTKPATEVRLVTPPPTSDIYSTPSDGSSPVRPSQRRPLAQRSVNTTLRRASVQVISSDDEEPHPPSTLRQRLRPVSDESENSSASSGTESDTSIDIRRLQKKTNGVLPASWWKLDQRRQKEGIESTQRRTGTSLSPAKKVNRPGVARAKISNRPRQENWNDFLLTQAESDEQSSSSDTPTVIPPPRPRNRSVEEVRDSERGLNGWIGLDDDDVVMEDDRIDAMLQKSSSRKKQTTLNFTRTKKLRPTEGEGEIWGSPGKSSGKKRDNHGSHRRSTVPISLRQSRLTSDSHTRGPKGMRTKLVKPKAPRISVADVYRYHRETTQLAPPRFLKVAHRTAKLRRNGARSGPEGKLFVMDTENDTREVQEMLREWREGTLGVIEYAQRLGGGDGDRGAEIDRREVVNLEAPGGPIPGTYEHHPSAITSETLSIHPIFHKPSLGSPKPRQTTLSGLVQRRPISSTSDKSRKPLAIKPLAALRNRQTVLQPLRVVPSAQVEAISGEYYRQPPVIRAAIPLIDILREQRPARPTDFSHPALGKFLEDDDAVISPLAFLRKQRALQAAKASIAAHIIVPIPSESAPPARRHTVRRVRRKQTPQRIDVDIRERRQPPQEHVPMDNDEPIEVVPPPTEAGPVLTGLAPYGTKYSLNFDTHPLKQGTFFNSETFIGAGELSRALTTPSGSSRQNSSLSVNSSFGGFYLHWGIYRDSIASEFESVMEHLMDGMDRAFEGCSQHNANSYALQEQAYSFYRFTLKYVARILYFSDSVDLVSFGQRFLRVLSNCLSRAATALAGIVGKLNTELPSVKMGIQTLWFVLLLSFQIICLCEGMEGAKSQLQPESIIKIAAKSLVSKLYRCGIEVVRQCYEDQRVRSRFERGVGNESYVIEAWVITLCVLDKLDAPSISFWRLLNSELHLDELDKVADAAIYERCWRTVFSLLPLFQFNSDGIVSSHNRSQHKTVENWELLKKLASVVFKHYKYNGDRPTINDYLRIIYTRTYHLITKWEWENPETMIATLFGFFASSGFSNLRNEQDYGSPLFLQNLEGHPSLETEESDRCFHLLLKLIAVSLKQMRSVMDGPSSVKKIQNYVFRLMPNHRRQYPKEEELRMEHLTALRNHHDLLCTLYWASPPGCRPPLKSLRDLVDPQTSHIQTCAVSIRAWSYLIRFQLHSDEDLATLDPLMEWYDDLMIQTLAQHNACRAEVMKQFAAEKEKGNMSISEEDLEDTIRRNQRQLEGLLLEAVRALGTAIKGVKEKLPSATKIMTPTATGKLFSSINTVSTKLVMEALDVVMQYLNACLYTPPIPDVVEIQQSEESQDYGDITGMEEVMIQEEKTAAAEHLLHVAYDPLVRMVLSAFGAEQQPAEVFLLKLLDTWVKVSGFLVQQGLKSWETFLGGYSHESWVSFPDTEQKNKFMAYYMSRLVENYKESYQVNKGMFLSLWLKTLVERKSMLKYQHDYTNALLNADPEHPMLVNLPFVRDEQSGRYRITLTEFELRRISLISSVLANMRVSYETAFPPSTASFIRKEYASMLQHLMASMKDNYSSLLAEFKPQLSTGQSSQPPSPPRTDAYVNFVQQIVELLQQHTIDIVPVDKFFTDSAAFPLPATDPTYVIGKLKNYGLKLGSARTYKQLIAFFLSVGERAAVDGQQAYLVDQLTRALTGQQESRHDENSTSMTLRGVFMHVVFPIYVQSAFTRDHNDPIHQPRWIMAIPVIKAVKQIVERIPEDIDSCDYRAVREVVRQISSWVNAVRDAAVGIIHSPGILFDPIMSALLVLIVESVMGCLPVLDWLLDGYANYEGIEERREQKSATHSVRDLVWLFSMIRDSVPLTDIYNIDDGELADHMLQAFAARSLRITADGNPFAAMKAELRDALIRQDWQPDPSRPGEWICARRQVSSVTTRAWREVIGLTNDGMMDNDHERERKAGMIVLNVVLKQFLKLAARTRVAWQVVREVDGAVWLEEVRQRRRRWEEGQKVHQNSCAVDRCQMGGEEVLFC